MNSIIPADLLELKARFETWRTNRKYLRESIPDELWNAAADLSRRYPPSLRPDNGPRAPRCRLPHPSSRARLYGGGSGIALPLAYRAKDFQLMLKMRSRILFPIRWKVMGSFAFVTLVCRRHTAYLGVHQASVISIDR